MTTLLATRDKDNLQITCDSQGTINNYMCDMEVEKCRKVSVMWKGIETPGLLGLSGDSAVTHQLTFQIENCVDLLSMPGLQGNYSAILLIQGEDYCLSIDAQGVCVQTLPFAVGSGAHFAIGAFYAGATPQECVRISCQLDVYSGGEIHEYKILRV